MGYKKKKNKRRKTCQKADLKEREDKRCLLTLNLQPFRSYVKEFSDSKLYGLHTFDSIDISKPTINLRLQLTKFIAIYVAKLGYSKKIAQYENKNKHLMIISICSFDINIFCSGYGAPLACGNAKNGVAE